MTHGHYEDRPRGHGAPGQYPNAPQQQPSNNGFPWGPVAAGVSALALIVVLVLAYFQFTGDDEKNEADETDSSETLSRTDSADTDDDEDSDEKDSDVGGDYTGDLTPAEQYPETVNCTYFEDGEGKHFVGLPPSDDISARGSVAITFKTSAGDIPMVLNREFAPCGVNAIEYLADEGFYDGIVCHRLTTEGIYVLQCGDPIGDGTGGPGFTFDDEFPVGEPDLPETVEYARATVALANAGLDGRGRGTNGSQFFLVYEPSGIPPDYTYLGEVTEEGLKTLDKIAAQGLDPKSEEQSPGDGSPKLRTEIRKTEKR